MLLVFELTNKSTKRGDDGFNHSALQACENEQKNNNQEYVQQSKAHNAPNAVINTTRA